MTGAEGKESVVYTLTALLATGNSPRLATHQSS